MQFLLKLAGLLHPGTGIGGFNYLQCAVTFELCSIQISLFNLFKFSSWSNHVIFVLFLNQVYSDQSI